MPRNDSAHALMPVLPILLLVASTSMAEEWTAPRTAGGHPDLPGHLGQQQRHAARAAGGLRRQGDPDGRGARRPQAPARGDQGRVPGRRPARRLPDPAGARGSRVPRLRPGHRELQLLLARRPGTRQPHVTRGRPAGRPHSGPDRAGDGTHAGRRGLRRRGARRPRGHAGQRALHQLRRAEHAGRLQQLLPDLPDGESRRHPPGTDSRRAPHPARRAGAASRGPAALARRLARLVRG